MVSILLVIVQPWVYDITMVSSSTQINSDGSFSSYATWSENKK